MKRSLTWLAEAATGAGIAALAAVLAFPAAPRALPIVVAGPRPGPTVDVSAAEPAIVHASATPTRIAALFGWKPPARVRPAATPRPAPAKPVPPRLKVIGFVERDDGTISWIFKDVPTGVVISLAPGETSRGWTLAEAGDREFRLLFKGAAYTIPRGK